MYDAILNLDRAILLFVQENLRCPALDVIMPLASFLGDYGMLWIAMCVVLLIIKSTRRAGIATLASLAAEYCVCDLVLKNIFRRVRPYLTFPELTLLVPMETSASFPSGHSASSFVCAYMLTRIYGKKGAWAYLPASLIALSRIYVGVHYTTDVLAGMALGTIVGVIMYRLLLGLIRGKKNAD